MAQQTATAFATGETSTVIQNVQSRVMPVPVRNETVPHRRSHRVLGVIQMTLGSICILLSFSGLFVWYPGYHHFGSGIYSGVFFFFAGLFGFLAAKQNRRGLIVGCMVMNIIGAIVAIFGLSFAAAELSSNGHLFHRYMLSLKYSYVKCIFVLLICIAEFFITIVHAGFTCASCCDCCLPRQAMTVTEITQGPFVIHQGIRANAIYPAPTYHDSLLQRQSQQIIFQQQYPQPPQVQISSRSHGDYPLSYYTASSHEIPGANPPPYSHIAAKE